jgi:hypothetical protein
MMIVTMTTIIGKKRKKMAREEEKFSISFARFRLVLLDDSYFGKLLPVQQ